MRKLGPAMVTVLVIAVAACRNLEETDTSKTEPITITALYPPSAAAGVPFQTLPDGSSTIGVAGSGFSGTSVVYFDERPLKTNFQNPQALGAVVPSDLIARQGRVLVTVRDPSPAPRRSEPSPFEVLAPRGADVVPKISALYPAAVRAGDVSRQTLPDKTWSIGVAGSGFGPKTKLVFDGRPVRTLYQSPGSCIAYVPVDLLAAPRKVNVTLEDPDAPASKAPALSFEIQ